MDAATLGNAQTGVATGAWPRTQALRTVEGGTVMELGDVFEAARLLEMRPRCITVLQVLAVGAGSMVESPETGPLPLCAGGAPILFTSEMVLRISLRGPCRLLLVTLAPELVGEASRAAGGAGVLHAGLVRDHLVAGLMAELRPPDRPTPAGDAESTRRLLGLLALRLFTMAPRPRGAALPAWRLRRLERHLEEHLAERITLADMARVVGLSHFHFARCFKQTLGETPREYVLRQRVERACALMATADSPLAEVAQASGFRTQAHFSHVFRRLTGMAPRSLRAIIARQREATA